MGSVYDAEKMHDPAIQDPMQDPIQDPVTLPRMERKVSWHTMPCYVISITSPKAPGASLQLTLEQLRSLGARPEVVWRTRDPRGGRLGAFLSHQAVAQKLLDSDGSPYCCVFEEDADLVLDAHRAHAVWDSVSELWGQAAAHNGARGPPWDFISLGSTFKKHVGQTKLAGGFTAYKVPAYAESIAYLLSRRGAWKIVSWAFADRPFDIEFGHHDMDLAVLRPSVFIQRHLYASNSNWHPDVHYLLQRVGLGRLDARIRLTSEARGIHEGLLWAAVPLLTAMLVALVVSISLATVKVLGPSSAV